MGRFKEIYEGFLNLMTGNKPQYSLDRAKKCLKCTNYRSKSKTCKLCGCFLPAKVVSPSSSCPIKKW